MHQQNNLGVTLDSSILENPCSQSCSSRNFKLRRISSIRRLLTTEATATLISAFTLSRLDYCNSLLSGSPRSLIRRIQNVQNNAVRLILVISKRQYSFLHIAYIRFRTIDSRIKYKCLHVFATTVFLQTLRPTSLTNLPLYYLVV